MSVLSFSSECYYIKVSDLLELEKIKLNEKLDCNNCDAIILVNEEKCLLCYGDEKLKNLSEDDFVKTKVGYYSMNRFVAFIINLIKPVKRKFYLRNNHSFRVLFDELLGANLTRGERNRENAYQWTNKRWKMSREEANKKYNELYNSIKENGYDQTSPMIVMLNRKMGVKDQILQGHHRIGICKELDIKEVNVCFWATPMSFKFLRLFVNKK